jgi:hypothetical protein
MVAKRSAYLGHRLLPILDHAVEMHLVDFGVLSMNPYLSWPDRVQK